MTAKTKGLGKGLEALLGKTDAPQKKEAAVTAPEQEGGATSVKIRLIEPNREQPRKRFDEAALQELADSIRIHGVIQPLIVVRSGSVYKIIAGERRWRAAKLAGLKEVPVFIRDYTDKEIAEISLIENIQREDLDPIEEAEAFRKLLTDHGLTQDELAERVSKSRTAITNSLRLLKLPEDARERVADGTLSVGHAKVLLGLKDADKQSAAAASVVERNLSVRETELLVKKLNGKDTPKTKERKELSGAAEYKAAEKSLTEKLGTRVHIKRRTEKTGTIEITYYSPEDIDRILEKIR